MNDSLKVYTNPSVITAVIVSVATVVTSLILATHLYQLKSGANIITVTGSTQQVITSDRAQWSGSFSRTVGAGQIKLGSDQIKKDTDQVITFLHAHGVTDDEITLSPLNVYTNYNSETDSVGRSSQVFSGYTLTQNVTVQSNDIGKVGKIATDSSALIAAGIIFQSSDPQYFYSKLGDLKIALVSDAAADARVRAEKIAASSGSHVGGLRSASMGVIQITPETSSDVSEEGYVDTTSIKKKITIIVHANFFVR